MSGSEHIKFSLKYTKHWELALSIEDKEDIQNTC